MNRAILSVSAASLTVLLAAFGPPELPGERSQQGQLRTWIPEPKAEEPTIAAPDLPRAPSPSPAPSPVPPPLKMTHMPAGMACADSADNGGPQHAAKQFVEAYSAAKRASNDKRWDDAMRAIEAAAAYAEGGRQWTALEQMRIDALFGLRDPANALAVMDEVIARGCAPPDLIKRYQDLRPAVRGSLGLPPG